MRVLFSFLVLVFVFTATAQDKKLIATKGKRVLSFSTEKKYIFTFILSDSISISTIKGKYKIENDTTITIMAREKIQTFSLSKLLQVYDYRSFKNRVGAVGSVLLGTAILTNEINNSGSAFAMIIGGFAIIDGVATFTGFQDVLTLGNKPSVYRGFRFSIKPASN